MSCDVNPYRSQQVWVALAIAILVAAGITGVLAHVNIYADGANYLLKLLTSGDYVHIAQNRIFATYLTQTPLIIALTHYDPGVAGASAVHGITLFGVPVLAFGYALWLARANPVAFFLTVAAVSIVFFSTIFVIVGEFHVLYSLTWLYAVIITSNERRSGLNPLLLLAAAVVTIKSYEAVAVTAPALMVMTLAALHRARRSTDKAFLLLLTALLAVATFFGVLGYVNPRDPGNAGGFVTSMLKIVEDGDLFLPVGLVLAGGAAAFIPNAYARWTAVAVVGILALSEVTGKDVSGYPDVLSTGSPNTHRAQALPFLLALLGLLFLDQLLGWGRRLARWSISYAPLLLPLTVAFVAYTVNVDRWRGFVAMSCDELANPSGEAYYAHPLVKTFGWDWEMPTLAVLLRPAGSTAMLRFPGYAGWYPFDPDTEQPDIDAFKRGAPLCPR